MSHRGEQREWRKRPQTTGVRQGRLCCGGGTALGQTVQVCGAQTRAWGSGEGWPT